MTEAIPLLSLCACMLWQRQLYLYLCCHLVCRVITNLASCSHTY